MKNIEILRSIRNNAIFIYIFFCSLFMSLFAASCPLRSAYIGDSAVFVYIAKIILDGGIPYRDTFDHKGPLIYLIDSLGLLIDDKVGIWLIELLTIFIIFLFAYKIICLVNSNCLFSCLLIPVSVLILLYYFQGGNLTEEYACAFIIVSLYFFLDFYLTGNFSKHALFLCGASFISVCMLRVNMIALWIVMCIAILIKLLKNREMTKTLWLIKWFTAGMILVAIPILAWIIKNGAFYALVDNYIFFNLRYSSNPEMASFYNICKAIEYFVLNPFMLVSITGLIYLGVKKHRLEDRLCLSVLLLSIIMSSISGRKTDHYGIIFYPLIIYALARLCSLIVLTNIESAKSKYAQCVASVLILLAITYYLFVPWISFLNVEVKENSQVASLVKSVTNKTDRISVCGNNNSIYILSERRSASRFSYQFPVANIDSNIWEEYLNDLKKLTAKVIVVLPGCYEVFPYKNIRTVLDESYVIVGKVGETEVYLLKSDS